MQKEVMGEKKIEAFSLKQLSKDEKILLLKELEFQTDGEYVLDEKGVVIKDKYIGIPVQLGNMIIFPGSTLILDNNELSIAMYISEYGDPF